MYIETCLSPELIHLHTLEEKITVVIDIFRATSCMTTALAHGAISIKPVASTDECYALGKSGYKTAAERGGKHVDGFDFGNSPIPYTKGLLQDKKLAMTTTNGTLAITKSLGSDEVVIGSFLNISSLANYLVKQQKPIILHCAGWKGNPNLEDTVFAGGLINRIKTQISDVSICDSSVLAETYHESIGDNLFDALKNAAHVNRLLNINPNILEDISFCLSRDTYEVIPELVDGELVAI